jgi:class 3 adenylate cyclase
VDCSACSTSNLDARRFCRECGAPLVAPCPACGFENQPSDKFCGGCGVRCDGGSLPPTPVRAPVASRAPPPTPLSTAENRSAERRLLTVMFCDLAGSTALTGRLDPEDLREVEGAYQRGVAEAVTRCGGYVARYMGDGVLAYFGYPRASGDDAECACRAGLAAVEATSELDRTLGAQHGVRLHARVGIATGLVVVGELIGDGEARERSVVGETPNLAARLEGVAAPDTVVISPSTQKLVTRSFELEDLGLHPLKGFEDPVRAWRVVEEATHAMRFDATGAAGTPFVGRGEELATLHAAWASAQRGDGRVVTLRGEAGVGKSRLAAHLTSELDDLADVVVVQCSSHHSATPLHPFLQEVSHAAGLSVDDDHDARARRLAPVVGEEEAALFARVLGAEEPQESAEERRARLLDALVQRLLGARSLRAQLVVVEDVQDADPTSAQLLARLAEEAEFQRALLIVTHRASFPPKLGSGAHLTRVDCGPLDDADSAALIESTAGHPVPAEVAALITQKADGVPLFIEELTRSLIDDEHLTLDGDAWRLAKPLAASAVPGTLQASLIARLDRLGDARRAAQVGATIGRRFERSLLDAVSEVSSDELAASLAHLVDEGVVERQGHGREEIFVFKQALFQEVAYDTLLRRERERLHGRIADALRVGERPDLAVVASHLERAGRDEDALPAWRDAAAAARADAAPHEAMAHLRRADALLKSSDPRERAPILLDLAELARLVGDLPTGRAAVSEVESTTDDPGCLARASYILGNLEFFAGRASACERAHLRALELAKKAGSNELKARALGGLADATFMQGRHSRTLAYATECIELCKRDGMEEIEAANTAMLLMPLFWRVELDEVERAGAHSLELARRQNATRAEAVNLLGVGMVARERMKLDESELASVQAEAIFRRLRSRWMRAAMLYYRMRATRLRPAADLAPIAEEASSLIAGGGAAAFNIQVRIGLALANIEGHDDPLALAETELARIKNPIRAMWGYDDMLEYALRAGEWERAERYVDEMLAMLPEPLRWAELLAEMVRAIAGRARGEVDADDRLASLRSQLEKLDWKLKLWLLDRALEKL